MICKRPYRTSRRWYVPSTRQGDRRVATGLTGSQFRRLHRNPSSYGAWESGAVSGTAAGWYRKQKTSSGLVLSIAVINLWNRLNAATKQVAGAWTAQYV